MNDDWQQDTTDVLHCSMPPQVRAHIEQLRAENARLRAAEVPLSANVGFAVVVTDRRGPMIWGSGDQDAPYPTADEVRAFRTSHPHVPVALIPLAAWDRT